MHLLGYIWMLSCWTKSAQAEAILQQTPREILAARGEDIELICNLKRGALNEVFWYRLDGNSQVHFLKSASVLNRQASGEGITGRFILTRDTFRLSFSLTIKDTQLSDNGTYYCLMLSSYSISFGGGSVVTVVPERKKVTSPPPTTKRRRSHHFSYPKVRNKKQTWNHGYVCSWSIWGSLTACNLLLLSSIAFVVIKHKIQITIGVDVELGMGGVLILTLLSFVDFKDHLLVYLFNFA
ncbi:T-cell surface glycoprotein CD8 beta chain-like [Hemiscyllium ocellatum]|uniref:T-cell surface glycoprotein CD8 beta chain-like n=1 Tax=Hemiscyllium ocellatum TaxID=170820 RepID=UPI002967169C|nr:T-cell surface glycoprotein CD8 beta chain-like [Hemiscyllium ocellatum]